MRNSLFPTKRTVPLKKKKPKKDKRSFWQFALVNGRLAEVYFEDGGILGYCYVEAKEYKTQKEKRWIAKDTQRFQITYRKGEYRDRLTGKKLSQTRPIKLKKPELSVPFKM